jgi:hypothetical protein
VSPQPDPPLYDIEKARDEMRRFRGRNDPLARETRRFGDKLAANVQLHFTPEELDTAGRVLLLAAASIAGLPLPLPVAANIVAVAGERLTHHAPARQEP